MSEFRNKLHGLMNDGLIDPQLLAEILINWMSEDEAQDFCEQSDVSEFFEEEEEEEDEEPEEYVDGMQARYVYLVQSDSDFYAAVYYIGADGLDTVPPAYEIDNKLRDEMSDEIDMDSAEEVIDWLRNRDGLPYLDHYLSGSEDPVMTTD